MFKVILGSFLEVKVVRLSELLRDYFLVDTVLDRDILHLALDSRLVTDNTLFFAKRGTNADGRQYIDQAIKQGASAILVDGTYALCDTDLRAVPIIYLPDLALVIGDIAARFYSYPAKSLKITGITGTSGKTSCTHFIAQAWTSLQQSCGVMGTLGSGFLPHLQTTGLTTVDAVSLQAKLREFVQQGASRVAMEVSSHSIDQARINGTHFDVGIYTNLSQDHLDYHGDMATYAKVKRRFLTEYAMRCRIINADDECGRQWLHELSPHTPELFAYSTHPTVAIPASIPLVYADKIRCHAKNISAHIHTPWGEADMSLPLIGEFNLSNVLATLTTLCVNDVPFHQALDSLATLRGVPGRMQMLGGNGLPLIVVDYAHKPDALEKVLRVLSSQKTGKLWCIFGCGGERDRGKRPIMAKIAEKWADYVVLTNDNPRSEAPDAIIAEIMAGLSSSSQAIVELDRALAIKYSIQQAMADDCVLIAGKGAENYQQIGSNVFAFSDVAQAEACLNERSH